MSAFEDLGLLPELIRAVDEMGWLLPSAIQSEAIPLILGGGDVLAAAETGSGKTGAFALPLLQLVQESIRSSSSASMHNNKSEIGPVVLNTSDCDSMLAISPDGLSCQSVNDSIWQGGRANTGVCSGSAYFEVKIEDDGLCRVGWSSLAAAFDIGTDKHSFGYGGSGKKSFAKKFETYGEPFGRGDIIGSSLDWNTRQISFLYVFIGSFQIFFHIAHITLSLQQEWYFTWPGV
jgi:ATP-dependent RNA helicase DDX1